MADPIAYELRDGLGWLRMDDGKVNAMDLAWCTRIQAHLDIAEADSSSALVLSGRAGCFSAGLDFKTLADLPMEGVRETTDAFMATMKRFFLFPKPVIAASTGHAVAGGLMLLLTADIRLAASDTTSRYGLSEASAGVPFLGGTLGICRYGIPQPHHTELILHGRMLDVAGCLERGVVHEVLEPAHLMARASERAAALNDLDLAAYATNKLLLREEAFERAARQGQAMMTRAPRGNVFGAMADTAKKKA